MRRAAALVVLAFAAAPAAGEVVVKVAGTQVDLTATAAPLADVLDRLARQTGMKVVYEGPAPRQLVTLSLHGRTPAETVLALLEGLGLNFALVADPSGARVQTLVVAGTAAASAASTAPASGRSPAVAPPTRRPFGPPPGSTPEPLDAASETADDEPEVDEPNIAGLPPGMEAADPGAQSPADQAAAAAAAQVPMIPPPGAGAVPTMPATPFPSSPFSSSPFTPQPQPFPPGVPGAPAGTAEAPPQAGTPANSPPQ
jgi:hypothetical protein